MSKKHVQKAKNHSWTQMQIKLVNSLSAKLKFTQYGTYNPNRFEEPLFKSEPTEGENDLQNTGEYEKIN